MKDYRETPEYKALQIQFHRLWSADVGTDGYDKQMWKALDDSIHKALVAASQR